MHKWVIAGLATLTVAAAGPLLSAANAKPTRTCSVSAITRSAGIAVLSGNPPRSGSELSAGIVDATLCGQPFHGALRDIAHFPAFGKVNGTGTLLGPQGSISISFDEIASPNADHSVTLHGAATITSGTGLYRGATGSGTLTGTQAANSDVTDQHMTGTITY
jgi:hypothetical protein